MLNHPNISPWPQYEKDEIEAASETLNSGKVNYWTGDLGKQFEVAYAESVGKKYGLALANGTIALELALRTLGVKAGDEVIVASRSYVASASCVLLLNATPIFADIDVDSGNISVETITPLITDKTKAIIPVHVGGWPCDMSEIMTLANQHGFKVIEDCAQAHGAYVSGKPVGAWGHAAIFSFCQDKIISTGGEGGMLLLDDEKAYKTAWAYKDIGRGYDAVFHQSHPEGFKWMTETIGSNFRMTEFQAAIGLKQLTKLPKWVKQRSNNAQAIIKAIKQFDFIEVPMLDKAGGNQHAYYRLYAKIKPQFTIASMQGEALRNYVIREMNAVGVPCFSGSCAEIYREKVFVDIEKLKKKRLNNAAKWADNGICFLVHHTITSAQLKNMTDTIECVMLELMKKMGK